MFMPDILYYTVYAIIFLALFLGFIRLFKTKVWIKTRMHKGPLQKIGFMDCNDASEAPEVHLSGDSTSPALGRIIIPENSDNANVELQTENIHTDSGRSSYKTCGYITPEGLIYKKIGNRSPEYIGYTARPSAPDVPTVVGERTWRSLWLRCTLNAYAGQPGAVPDDKTKKSKGKKKDGKLPAAVCYFTGFHNSKNDFMPPEARAAAFAMLYGRLNRRDYREYYNSTAYGWKDTALLAAVIYIVVYMVIYFYKVTLLGETLIGPKKQTICLAAMFFAIWALVRTIKIECIERSDTIQPRIDLFNKALGQRKFDALILIASGIILSYSDSFYNLDFIPVALAAEFGIVMNMTLRNTGLRWKIEDVFKSDDEDESSDATEYENPPGEIAVNYNWTLDAPTKQGITGEVTLYFDSQYIADLRHINPFFSQRNDKPLRAYVTEMFSYMNKHASVSARCRYLAKKITDIAAGKALTELETMQFMLDFVQEPNIAYRPNVNSKAIDRLDSYIRFPDEVLFDKEADATSKALLAAALFHFMSRRVLFMYSRKMDHAAIAVEAPADLAENDTIFGIPVEDAAFVHNGVVYIFCETTGDGLRLGGTLTGMRHSDFEERIELPEVEFDDDTDDAVTCLYRWSLDSLLGNYLEGSYTLEFSRSEIAALREKNPFRTYGSDSNTYEGNIASMFAYLHADRERTAKVREIAKYIYSEIKRAGLPELDLVQFALDFCQMPNIQYCVDEDSTGINFAKEYMRFPDEVLFDKEGDCDCKSSLTASLFHELGYNVLVMISSKLKHAAIAIECNPAWEPHLPAERRNDAIREHNGRRYLFCETTGDGNKVGGIEANSSIHDFEIVVEIPV